MFNDTTDCKPLPHDRNIKADIALPPPLNKAVKTDMPETLIKSQIIEWLSYKPEIWCLKIAAHHGYGSKGASTRSAMKGVPDLLICVSGHLYAVELKIRGGRLSSEQLATMRKMREAGANVAVAMSLGGCQAFLIKAQPAISDWVVPIYL
jgi:hypothetical protein